MLRPLAALAVLTLVLAGCGSTSHQATTSRPPTRPAVTTRTAIASTLRAPRPHRVHHRRPRPGPDPGSLPQTDQLPSAHTPAFRAEMHALWRAIASGSARRGRAAFFPEAAYAQVKALADPEADYTGRLLGDFALDVAAAHALLGSDASRAHLLEVLVPAAHWVGPNVCLNRVGYYEVPNARVVYALPDATRSFGIASMISWRGVWYVVHLGAVVRRAAVGVVDDPSAGAGISAPSATC